MYYHIEGTVAELGGNLAVIDCGGVGYELNVSYNTLAQLRLGERAKLYVAESVKEDAFDLYGFATRSEKRSFQLLIGVSGVGPRAALSILSSSTPEGLAMAILSGDEKALTVERRSRRGQAGRRRGGARRPRLRLGGNPRRAARGGHGRPRHRGHHQGRVEEHDEVRWRK